MSEISTSIYIRTIKKRFLFINKYKSILFISTIIFQIISSSFSFSQTSYSINFSDTSTYHVTCGKVVSSQWSVKNDSCILYTPYLKAENPGITNVTFSIKINQSGNGDINDKAYVFHAIDIGSWQLDTMITAGGSPAVYTYNDSVTLNFGHYIRFMLAMQTNAQTEFWAIKNAEIIVANVTSYSVRPLAPSPDSNALPVELVRFTSLQQGNDVLLNWATASESNNDYFTIEKSIDGLNYYTLAEIKGEGNSNSLSSYSFQDADPSDVTYYRLKQTDFDGNTNDVGLTWCKLNRNISLNNPVISYSEIDDDINISIYSGKEQSIRVSIYDLNGNILLSEELELIKGFNQKSIKLPVISKELTIVKVGTNEQSFYAKINIL